MPPHYAPPPVRKSFARMTDDEYYYHYKNASAAWYLLPIFLGFLGGLIMWAALRNVDPRKARKGLLLGVILLLIGIVIAFIIMAGAGATAAAEVYQSSTNGFRVSLTEVSG